MQRVHGSYGRRHVYSPTPRLVALAGQLAARLPLVTRRVRVVGELQLDTLAIRTA